MGVDAHDPSAYLDYELYEKGLEALRDYGLETESIIRML